MRRFAISVFSIALLSLVSVDAEAGGFWFHDGPRIHRHSSRCDHRTPSNPVPEPSAALLFGAGALVVYAATRKRRQ